MNIDKLPKWAKEHISNLERSRDAAVRALRDYTDDQTPAPFSVSDYVSDNLSGGPTFHKRYVQTHTMEVNHAGVELRIVLRDGCIDLQWNAEDDRQRDLMVMQPRSMNSVWLMIGSQR